jgi:hypothetical protein
MLKMIKLIAEIETVKLFVSLRSKISRRVEPTSVFESMIL